MPLSFLPVLSESLTLVAPATTYELVATIASNCKEIIVYNTDAAARCLIWFGDPAGAVGTAANSLILPAGASITLAIGPEGERQPQTIGGGNANQNLCFAIEAALANVIVNVSLVNCRGFDGK